MALVIYLRGGGDLASGVALRLHRAGFRVLITELPQPLVVRRLVAFAEAIYQGQFTVEGVTAVKALSLIEAWHFMEKGWIPVMVDPQAESYDHLREMMSLVDRCVLVDARMLKNPPKLQTWNTELVIGLGPGFVAGENCHAVIETNRGHRLGRVVWQGGSERDTGVPDPVAGFAQQRVLRAPASGELITHAEICDHIQEGQLIAEVGGQQVIAPFKGILRGLLHPGLNVWPGLKIGDLDPRDDLSFCSLVSDKSLAVGGGVLEAILSRPDLRLHLWH